MSREWYGVKCQTSNTTKQYEVISELLSMYADAITKYFSVTNSSDYSSIESLDKTKLSKDKQLFLEWFIVKGLPFLKSLAELHLPDNVELISKIEYDMYILEEEMDFQYPDDVRSTLINIVNDMPEYIKAATEIAVTVNCETQDGKWDFYIYEPSKRVISNSYPNKKDNYEYMSKYEESTFSADSSFFILQGVNYGNFGVLQNY
ncbi:hypothetical protein [Sporosarcina sp. ITBMC105]